MKYYAGIDLGGTKAYSIIIDEKGNILSRAKQKVGTDKTINVIMDLVYSTYLEAIEKANITQDLIEAVGMALPGPVDIHKGVLLHAPNLGLENIKINELLSQKTGKPVFCDNDVNLGTFGEYSNLKIPNLKHVYGIFAGTGIGGGYISEGKLVRGAGSTAGEIGHIIVKYNGPKCNCGNKGCLEAIAGKVGIVEFINRKNIKTKKKTSLDSISPAWRTSLGSSALKRAFDGNDKLVKKAIMRSATYLGIAAANIVNLIGVEAIILGGGLIEEMSDIYLPIIEKVMKNYAIAGGADLVKLIESTLADDAVAYGAAMILTHKNTVLYRNTNK